ncbi:hypothetical protein [Aeoliella mucimassa]|nr:hypothetical protein [Aeoliella mucimassa]
MSRPVFHAAIWLTCLALAGLAYIGCTKGDPTLDQLVEKAAELPGVRGSKHSKLREEFRLVEQAQALPKQLNRDQQLQHKNAAVALKQTLPDAEQVSKINEMAGGLLSAVPAADIKLLQTESGSLAARWVRETSAVAEATRLEKCDFGLRYEWGYFNDLDFVYSAAAASRLLLLDALYRMDDLAASTARFEMAWKWTDWLSESGHLEARVQAALVRREALYVAEAIANSPEAKIEHLRQLESVLQDSLNNWPPLEETLNRERALAIATYESIRLGLADMLFTYDERKELRSSGVYTDLRHPSDEQVDADEAAYLTYMREIIAVANQPYYQRAKQLVECDRLLRSGEQIERYPWFANHLFVLNNSMTMAQAELARDRARVEGWLHLLSEVTESEPPANKLNPLNGEAYAMQTRGSQKYVALGDRRSVNPRLTLPGE